MPEAISDTSPLVYLHRIEGLGWVDQLFAEVWMWVSEEIKSRILALAGE